jgi:hypothetical protein
MKRREVNLGRTDENIAEQYPNLCEGLQKDAGQNSWDARVTKKGKDWRLEFKYLPELNSLTIEDFGTLGMNAKRWKEYQSLWDTTKAEEATLGARGQGKFLFHYFAKAKLVLTESIDEEGNYRFSYGTSGEYDDETKKLADFIPSANPLNHQGTRIWIMDLKQDLRNELLEYKTFMNYIAATWWEVIRNYDATFIVNFDSTDYKVVLPELPVVEKEKVFPDEKISDLGKIKRLVLRYCKNEVPAFFRGIAVQRGGMTILRLPVSAEETIKNKIYGYCTFDEALELELKKVEFPNHFGFGTKRAWNHTKEYIRRKSEEFVQEISPIKKREITLPQDLVERAVRIVNELVREYAPELATGVTRPGGRPEGGKHEPPKPPPPIRIDIFRGNARKLEYDESLITECELVNDTNNEANLHLKIEVRHEEGDLKFNPRYTIVLDANKREKINIPLVDFQEGIDKPGEYVATSILQDGAGKELHKRSFTFYLHEEPPPPRGRVFLSTIVFSNGKGTPLERKKHLPMTEKGSLRIIYDHPDFVHVRELAGSRKAQRHEIFLYMIKCGIDEAVEKLLEFRYNEGQLDTDEIRATKDKCDAMYYDAVLSPIA